MLSSPTNPPSDADVYDEVLKHENAIHNVPEPSDVLDDDDSMFDDKSERSVIAQHNFHARIFPPPVLRPFLVQPKDTSTKISVASHHLETSSALSESHSDVDEHGGVAFSAQDHGSSFSPSESLGTDGDALEKSWFRIMHKKSTTSALRHKLSKVRRQTRKARVEKDAVDNAFMSVLRPLRFYTPSTTVQSPGAANAAGIGPKSDLDDSRLQELLEKMQEARNRCQAWELQLEALEDEFEIAQEELDYLERLFINDLRPGAQQISEEPEPEDVSMPEPLLGLTEEPIQNYHPLYMRFMSTLRDHSLAEEEYHDNLHRKALIEDDLHRLELVERYQRGSMESTMQPDTQDLDFLHEFEREEKKSIDRLAQLRDEAERLRQLCFKEGVVPRYAALMEIYTYYPWEFSVDPDPATESNKGSDANAVPYTTRARFWILLSNPRHLLEGEPMTARTALEAADSMLEKDPDNLWNQQLRIAAEKENIIEHLIRDAKEGDKGNFISRWALQRLRITPNEVELMYSSFLHETGLQVHDVHRWQQEVLYNWPRDEAARLPPEQYKGAISKVEASSEGSFSGSSLISYDNDSIIPSGRTTPSRDPGASLRIQIGNQFEANDEDATDSGNIENSPAGGPPPPPEELQALRVELSLDAPSKEAHSVALEVGGCYASRRTS